MILIEPLGYRKILPSLFQVGINHLFARAVVEQKIDGEVYVDDLLEPSTCYVKHAYGMSLLWGNHSNEAFNQALKSHLLNESGKRKVVEWLQVYPAAWNEKLVELLGSNLVENPPETVQSISNSEKVVLKYTRVNFRFNREQYVPFGLKPEDGLKLVKTGNGLFDRMQGTVVPAKFWRNEREFAETGAGFCLMKNDEPVSTAFSAFVHEPYLELGIETLPEFQGRGLAPIVCSALIDYCLERDLEPVWACRLENSGSFKLAQKLGFEVERMIPYYQLPI